MALSRRELRALATRHGETVTRVRRAMVRSKAGGAQAVPVEYVLDLLDPEGAWAYEAAGAGSAPEIAVPDPRADPITGCLPVTAEQDSH